MEWNTIVSVICGAIIAVGAGFFMYQLHNIVVIDAKTRGLKYPRLWGLLPLGNNTGGGIFIYMIRRRNCPVINISENDKLEIEKRKKASGIGLSFICLGTIGIIICQMLGKM